MLKRLFLFLFYLSLFNFVLFSRDYPIPSSKLIDTPINTFKILDQFSNDIILYNNGSILNWFEVGLTSFFNLGVSFNIENFIGKDAIKLNNLDLSLRLKIYNGNDFFPAINIGYFGNNITNAKNGFYALFEKEYTDDLFLGFGLNAYSLDSNIYGFANFRYTVNNKLLLMLEYNNIRIAPDASFNFGIRYYIYKNLSVGFALKNLKGIFDDGKNIEREFLLTYSSRFNFFN